MRVTALHIYPIKSCGGIDVTELTLGPRGPVGDRHWMVVDANGKFLTQRTHARMALIRMSAVGGRLRAEAAGSGGVDWDWLHEDGGQGGFAATVWKDTVKAVAARAEVNEWFSRFLGLDCRVVRLADGHTRRRDKEAHAWEVNFPDSAPILLINEASLGELNGRLPEALPMNRFRPNVVFDGKTPFVEDGWREIRIGSIEFPFMYACTRCVITTIDQQTAQRGMEPLKTLGTYRRVADGIAFGLRMVHRGEGRIKIGDDIQVLC